MRALSAFDGIVVYPMTLEDHCRLAKILAETKTSKMIGYNVKHMIDP